jgi:hypothetical protein
VQKWAGAMLNGHHATILHFHSQIALYTEQDRLRHGLAGTLTQKAVPDGPCQHHGEQRQTPAPIVAHRKTCAEQSQCTGNIL